MAEHNKKRSLVRNEARKCLNSDYTNICHALQPSIVGFKNALDKAELSTKNTIIADGKLHRIHVESDRNGSKSGWYTLFDSDIPPAGSFGSWKTGNKGTWCAKTEHHLPPKNRRRMIKARKAHEAALAVGGRLTVAGGVYV